MNPDDSPRVKALRARLASDAVDIGALESEVYDHLFSFFRRYYSEGDFLAKRVYKPGVYAIPYEGEEVTLHWANKDQYYIKTSEYLRDYAFRLRPDDESRPLRVHFRLVEAAEGEHGNVKAVEGKDRVFILSAPGETGRDFIAEEDGGPGQGARHPLRVPPGGSYRLARGRTQHEKKKPPAQKDLIRLATKRVLAVAGAAWAPWIAELAKQHVTVSGERAGYSSAGGAPPALHRAQHLRLLHPQGPRDLPPPGAGLLYIKNEVMHLDDVENESAPRVEQYLSKIKVIRKIAGKIIDFLAQLEDFQKKLWLKKKFVVETQYCITVGSIPEALYAEIAANEAQREEWVKLFAIDEINGDLTTPGYSKNLKAEFLQSNPTLVVDTRHFAADFTARLLEAIGDVEKQADGVLLHSENFQGLSLVRARYRGQVQSVCVDPPYNTGDDGFAYKDQYLHSSWVTMLANRFDVAATLLRPEGVAFVNIDDNEFKHLWYLLADAFGAQNYLGSMVWKRRSTSAMAAQPLSLDHEYILVFGRDARFSALFGLSKSEDDYPFTDPATGRRFASTDLTIGMTREQRPNQFFSITNPRTGKVYSGNPNRVWRFFPETMRDVIAKDLVIWPDEAEGNLRRPRYKTLFDPESMRAKPCSSWIDTASANDREIGEDEVEYGLAVLQSGMNSEGGRAVDRIFGSRAFAYPKPVSLIRSLVRSTTRQTDIVVDFFAGSGTTGHAVIDLNREDRGRRKFILVEMGDYFDTVLLPRIKKVTFTPEWKNGKPKRLASPEEAARSPRIVKVVRLESYQDALNNLETRRTDKQQLLLDSPRRNARTASKRNTSCDTCSMSRRAAAGRCSTCRRLPTPRPTS